MQLIRAVLTNTKIANSKPNATGKIGSTEEWPGRLTEVHTRVRVGPHGNVPYIDGDQKRLIENWCQGQWTVAKTNTKKYLVQAKPPIHIQYQKVKLTISWVESEGKTREFIMESEEASLLCTEWHLLKQITHTNHTSTQTALNHRHGHQKKLPFPYLPMTPTTKDLQFSTSKKQQVTGSWKVMRS